MGRSLSCAKNVFVCLNSGMVVRWLNPRGRGRGPVKRLAGKKAHDGRMASEVGVSSAR